MIIEQVIWKKFIKYFYHYGSLSFHDPPTTLNAFYTVLI